MQTILAALILAIAAGAASTSDTYIFPIDHSIIGPSGHPPYLTDAQIAARIPGLAGIGNRVDTCFQSMTIPNTLYITFPPTLTGPHTGRTNHLYCEQPKDRNEFSCRAHLSDAEIVFDRDPNHYFRLGPNTKLEDAVEVFNAFNNGHIQYSETAKLWIKGLNVSEIAQEGKLFSIHTGDCGCSDGIKVERRQIKGATSFVAVASLAGICI